jgi:hypothetical protein
MQLVMHKCQVTFIQLLIVMEFQNLEKNMAMKFAPNIMLPLAKLSISATVLRDPKFSFSNKTF